MIKYVLLAMVLSTTMAIADDWKCGQIRSIQTHDKSILVNLESGEQLHLNNSVTYTYSTTVSPKQALALTAYQTKSKLPLRCILLLPAPTPRNQSRF